MKRLVLSLVTALQLLVLPLTAHAQPRYWQVEIFEPANTTTGTTLKFEYKVMSTVEADSFTVRLYENGSVKGTQSIPAGSGGDSGAFTVALPDEGTYDYFVRAINHGAGDDTKDTDNVSVNVTDAPTRTVTVVRSDAAGGRGSGSGVTTTSTGTSGGGADGDTSGSVAGTTDTSGNVGDKAATTTGGNTQGENTENNQNPDQAGAQNNDNKGNALVYIGIPLAILALAGALYWWRSRGNVV